MRTPLCKVALAVLEYTPGSRITKSVLGKFFRLAKDGDDPLAKPVMPGFPQERQTHTGPDQPPNPAFQEMMDLMNEQDPGTATARAYDLVAMDESVVDRLPDDMREARQIAMGLYGGFLQPYEDAPAHGTEIMSDPYPTEVLSPPGA